MMPLIDDVYAWRLVRDARAADAAAEIRLGGCVDVSPGGRRWQAAADTTAPAAQLFDILLPLACAGPRLVVAQLGQSLDGRIATAHGHSHYVTSQPGRVHLHRLRALVDAVIVGVGTVNADDPQLTVRHVAGAHPVRVVLDPNGRVRRDRRVFSDGGPPTLHAVREAAMVAPGAEPLVLGAVETGVEIARALLDGLSDRGLGRVLVEGGGLTVSRFIEAECVDRLHTVVAPLLIGSGRPALTLPEIRHLDAARRPPCRVYPLGPDQLYDLDLAALRDRPVAGPGSPSTST